MNYSEARNFDFRALYAPHSKGNTNASASNAIDTQGYDSLTLVLQAGSLNNLAGDHEVQHRNTTSASWVKVPDEELVGQGNDLTIAATDDNGISVVDYVGINRYVRVTITPTTASGNNFMAGLAILGHARRRPVTIPTFG